MVEVPKQSLHVALGTGSVKAEAMFKREALFFSSEVARKETMCVRVCACACSMNASLVY